MKRNPAINHSRRLTRIALVVALAFVATMIGIAPVAAHADATTGTGGLFVAKTARIWDSTTGRDGAPASGLVANQWYTLAVAGSEGLPATGVSAVQLDFYVSNAAGNGVLNADTSSSAAPSTHGITYVNFGAAAVSGSGTLAVGADGKIRVKVSQNADLRIDVQGYYTAGATSAGGFVPTTPTPIKNYTGVASNTYLTFNVGGVSPVPSSASGVILSIQESGAHNSGYLIAYPAGAARPPTALYWPSTRNYDFSTAVALGTNGQVSLYVGTGGSLDLSISVQGFYTATAGTSVAGSFTPGAARVYDSRTVATPIGAGDTSTIQVTGVNGVPDVESGIDSVSVNIGIVAGTGATGHIQAFADDADPGASAQQFYASTTTSIFAVVALGEDGGISIQNSSGGSIDVVIDVEGWFQGSDPATITCDSQVTDGSWRHDPAPSTVTCTAKAVANPAIGAQLSLTVDGADGGTATISSSAPTSMTATFAAGAGQHTILASVSTGSSGPTADSAFTFGSGSWADANFVPSVADGSDSEDLAPDFFTDSDGAPFGDGVNLQYTVTSQADGTGIVAQSGWSPKPLSPELGTLVEGETYYWHAEAQGPDNDGSGIRDVTSPTWTFTATENPDLQDDAGAIANPVHPNVYGPSGCPTWVFIGIRGTTDKPGKTTSQWGHGWTTAGLGNTGNLASKLKKDLGAGTVYVDALNYPAAFLGFHPATSLYWNSVSKGQTALVDEMNNIGKGCGGHTKIWVAGHSQGAQVADGILSGSRLTKAAKTAFRGAALSGDPTYKPKEKIDANGNGNDYGLLYGYHKSLDSLVTKNSQGTTTQQVKSYCYAKDFFCQKGSSMNIHNSYNNTVTVNSEAIWLKQFS